MKGWVTAEDMMMPRSSRRSGTYIQGIDQEVGDVCNIREGASGMRNLRFVQQRRHLPRHYLHECDPADDGSGCRIHANRDERLCQRQRQDLDEV